MFGLETKEVSKQKAWKVKYETDPTIFWKVSVNRENPLANI